MRLPTVHGQHAPATLTRWNGRVVQRREGMGNMSGEDDWLALNESSEDDWLELDSNLDEQRVAPPRPTEGSFIRRFTGDQLFTIGAALLNLVGLFLPWYVVVLVSSTYSITGSSPLFLGFVGFMWSVVVLLLVPLMTRRFGGIAALLLIVMGAVTVGQVAVFATVSGVIGWAGRLVVSSIDGTVVDTRVGIGAYVQVIAGLIVIATGSIAFARSLSAEVRRLSK